MVERAVGQQTVSGKIEAYRKRVGYVATKPATEKEKGILVRNHTAKLIFDLQNLGFFVPKVIDISNGHLNSHKLDTRTFTLFKVEPLPSNNQHKELLTKLDSEAWPYHAPAIAQTVKQVAKTKPLEDR